MERMSYGDVGSRPGVTVDCMMRDGAFPHLQVNPPLPLSSLHCALQSPRVTGHHPGAAAVPMMRLLSLIIMGVDLRKACSCLLGKERRLVVLAREVLAQFVRVPCLQPFQTLC